MFDDDAVEQFLRCEAERAAAMTPEEAAEEVRRERAARAATARTLRLLNCRKHGVCAACALVRVQPGVDYCASCTKKRAETRAKKEASRVALRELRLAERRLAVEQAQQRLRDQRREKESAKTARSKYRAPIDVIVELRSRRKCEICGREGIEGRASAIDHDHQTGRIRGLLCQPCNTALFAIERVEYAKKAAAYLRRHGSRAPTIVDDESGGG